MMNDTIELIGLDGANPLAFLAALGTLRKLTHAWPTRNVKMSWKPIDGSWRPVLYLSPNVNEETIVQVLNDKLLEMKNHPAFLLGDNLNLTPDSYRVYAFKSTEKFFATSDRIWCDYIAAFGSESIQEDGVIKDTAFRTMQGAGHQHFIKFMRNIIEETNIEHIKKTLFESWKYDDPVPNLTLRFDPKDDSRYALQWKNPSKDSTRKVSGSMLGANRLAIEGIPFFPVIPIKNELITTGFKGKYAKDTFFTWPIWNVPLNSETVKSLISLKNIQNDSLDRNDLQKKGITEIYRSQRLTIGKVRNFTPARPV